MNQDSFFSVAVAVAVVDGNLKMIGVFDGHGEQGILSIALLVHTS